MTGLSSSSAETSSSSGIRMIGFEECFASLTPEATVDVLDRAAAMSRPSAVVRVSVHPDPAGCGSQADPGSAASDRDGGFPTAQFSAMAGQSLMFGHMGFVPDLGMCVKTGMQVPDNRDRGLDTVQASVLLFDSHTGVPQALLDGQAITIMRTAGALVAGIREALAVQSGEEDAARPRKVAVIGYGAQGRHVARLARAVLHPDRVAVFNRSDCAAEPGVEMKGSVAEAVAGAQVIACATSSGEPVLTLDQLLTSSAGPSGPNRGPNGRGDIIVGSLNSYEPTLTEIDPAIIAASASVHIDTPDPAKFGPIAHSGAQAEDSQLTGSPEKESRLVGSPNTDSRRPGAQGEGSVRLPEIRLIGDRALHASAEPDGRLGDGNLRTVLIGGHGLQDSLLAFAVLRGWSAVETATRRYTDSRGDRPQRQRAVR